MVNGDPESAQAVTHQTISDIQHDGTMITKTILVPLDNSTETIAGEALLAERPADMPPMPNMPNMDLDNTAQKTKSMWVQQLMRANLN